MERQKLIQIKLPSSVYKKVREKADENHMDVTSFIRMLIAKSLIKEVI